MVFELAHARCERHMGLGREVVLVAQEQDSVLQQAASTSLNRPSSTAASGRFTPINSAPMLQVSCSIFIACVHI
jgi:hypothetical protein